MSELDLPKCPICHAEESLFRETMERAGQPFTWYECQECGSVLLWMGDDQWAYQKVGLDDKAYLLKQPQSKEQLQALLPTAEDAFHSRGLGEASSNFVTLSCPSCGGQLEITSDIDRFACAHCGTEHIVRRGGGLVSLSPVVEEVQRVRTGVDKTASELAIQRLTTEIAELEKKKKKQSPEATGFYMIGALIAGSLCCFPFILAGSIGGEGGGAFIAGGILAAVVSLFVFGFLGMRADDRVSEQFTAEIRQKQAEIEKHKAIISQED